ncbi:MAG: transposase [Muribaculaceae bacterium]|nr:transposase [Muribaculaceae bacterium]
MDLSERYLQRAEWHDYTSRCSYLITLRSNPDIGFLSDIVAKRTRFDFSARWIPSLAGKVAMTCVRNINKGFPWVDVLRYAIMPDHIHLVLYVKEKTDIHLGKIINNFEITCTQLLYSKLELGIDSKSLSFFLPGYNDKIVYKQNQLETFKRYVEDNPRRYALRREHPEYFNRCQNVFIDGEYFTVFGNFHLLRHPLISPVIISRRDSEEEKDRKHREWNETIRGQGVLVSPFYSRAEKAIRDDAIASGAKIVKIVPNGLSERFKPSGKEFDLCCEGRLLIIAPGLYQTRKVELTRDLCLYGNKIADNIAKGAIDMRLLRLK